MKRLVFVFFLIFSLSSWLSAQDNECFDFFPTKEGAVIVISSYDAANNLICTTTYKVVENNPGPSLKISYTVVDSKGTELSSDFVKASCHNGTVYMTLSNKAFTPDIVKILGKETELIGNLLDYPDTFGTEHTYNGSIEKTESVFTIQSKKDKKKTITVKVSDRKYEKNEPINTPAGNFYASKVTFNMQSKAGKEVKNFKFAEWYAPNAGVIRSETSDENGKLLRYNLLTAISGNE